VHSINADLYNCKIRKAIYRQSNVKQLWWSCVVRDRIITIGLWQPIQIMWYYFDFSKETMLLSNLEEEIQQSDVYDPEPRPKIDGVNAFSTF
jgi:hypothetical protein